MFTLRQGIFEVKGQLKSFDPLPEGVRLNFVDGQFIEIPGVSRGLLTVMTTLGISKIQDATVDVVMGKVFLDQALKEKSEIDKKKQTERIKSLTKKVNEDNSTTKSK